MALAYLPPMIGGVVLAYRGKYLAGLAVTAIFSAFEVYANHVQMTYYFLFLIAFMIVAYFIDALRNRKLAHFAKATAVCAGAHFFHLESEHILSPLFNSAIEKSARKFTLRGVSPAVAFEYFFTFVFCLGREPQQREVGKFKLLALVALDYRYAVEQG